MFIVNIHFDHWEYHHAKFYSGWCNFKMWHASEGAWLVPGTDPDDPFYCVE